MPMSVKILLSEDEMPRQWYNIAADMPNPMQPPLHPGTGQPLGPQDLAPVFPMNLIEQEVSQERWIDIPNEVVEKLLIWRPTPLYRAVHLEKFLNCPVKIYYKNEGVSPAGSHKPNTAIPQAYYNKVFGIKRIATETGAGQWGSALSFACNQFGLEAKVYMVRVSYEQKPYRRLMMNTWGATCIPSPSTETEAGRKILAQDPNSPGSLGIAISEAVEDAVTSEAQGRPPTRYSLGSVLNHVLLHQTIIGQEAQKQVAKAGDYPDIIIGCAGGGSNFAGIAFPFLRDKIAGKQIQIIAVEPTSCPTMTKGPFAYDFGDTVQMTPLLPMHTLGHSFVPAPIHAGGLRYHGMAPLVCALYDAKIIEAVAVHQNPIFEAALQFARAEGIVPAPEPSHAIRVVIDEAIQCRERRQAKTIAFVLCGHGHFDLGSYQRYLAGQLFDYELPQEEIDAALKAIEGLPKPKM